MDSLLNGFHNSLSGGSTSASILASTAKDDKKEESKPSASFIGASTALDNLLRDLKAPSASSSLSASASLSASSTGASSTSTSSTSTSRSLEDMLKDFKSSSSTPAAPSEGLSKTLSNIDKIF